MTTHAFVRAGGSLGKGEVVSSILTGSTSKSAQKRHVLSGDLLAKENGTRRERASLRDTLMTRRFMMRADDWGRVNSQGLIFLGLMNRVRAPEGDPYGGHKETDALARQIWGIQPWQTLVIGEPHLPLNLFRDLLLVYLEAIPLEWHDYLFEPRRRQWLRRR